MGTMCSVALLSITRAAMLCADINRSNQPSILSFGFNFVCMLTLVLCWSHTMAICGKGGWGGGGDQPRKIIAVCGKKKKKKDSIGNWNCGIFSLACKKCQDEVKVGWVGGWGDREQSTFVFYFCFCFLYAFEYISLLILFALEDISLSLLLALEYIFLLVFFALEYISLSLLFA